MSDSPQAEGWWQASDGKWYPPELHPDAAQQTGPSDAGQPGTSPEGPPGEGYWQASDGQWYPPELHPDAQQAPQAPAAADERSEPMAADEHSTSAVPSADPGADDASSAGPASSDEPARSAGRETIFMPGAPAAEGSTPEATPPSVPPSSPPPAQPQGDEQPPAATPPAATPPAASPPPASPPPAGPPPGQPPASPPPSAPPPGQPPGAPPTAVGPGPGGPPPAGYPPAAGGGDGRKEGKAGRIILVILLVLALVVAAFAVNAVFFGDEAAADEVVLESIGDARSDPFTDPVAPEPAGSLLDYASQDDGEGHEATTRVAGYSSPDGSVPGVFGGSLNESACDPDLLEEFLDAEPERAEAWAGVVQISTGDIPAYLLTLTPVNLAADTRVLNHGFSDGEAIPRQSVLQRGSAVLVDRRGVPRVDCYSGSPLREPEPLDDESFSGTQWATFQRERVIVISEAPVEIDSFELRDVVTGDIFARPAGSRGDSDRPGTVDLVDDGPIEFDTVYEDSLIEGRSEARYLIDAPDGAVMTLRVENRRDSERRMRTQVFSEGSRFADFRLSAGASEEVTIILDHDGAAEFELIFAEGPAAYDFHIELQVQDDAGQGGDAGDDFDSAFEIAAGQPVEGTIGGQDSRDVFLMELQPGSEMVFDAEVARDSDRRVRFLIFLDGERLFDDRVQPGAATSGSLLFSGDDSGTLEVIVEEGGAAYALLLDFVEQQDGGQAGDAGNQLAEARQIQTGQELSGQVGHRDSADYYLFDAPADNVEIALSVDVNSDRRVRFQVEDPSGSRVADTRVNPGSTDSIAFEVEAGVEYRFIVSEGRGDYAFEIRQLTGEG